MSNREDRIKTVVGRYGNVGILGNKAGEIENDNGFVNVVLMDGQTIKVLNRTVKNIPGTLVYIGKGNGQNQVEVLYEIPTHATHHSYPQPDIINYQQEKRYCSHCKSELPDHGNCLQCGAPQG